ncbi:type IV secretion system protein [Sphingobium sufflavum]|uniref:type IV secretion system protein n=1 Tax=Sphingobium sufflavum TaxID=1129547 RepID=UPI001F42BD83|nr:type IV secretion system protein [Sphingobium sufflavum]MCE7798379.1 type IV secretion system protein [Sphingobium sufflavum]
MACTAILTGTHFLWSTLDHIDCQAQAIGSYGYGALSDPASAVSMALTGILTLFVALLGLRMMLGHAPEGQDIVGGAIRVGIVLTLATSWPAWRVIGHDMVLEAPAEIARAIGSSAGLANPGSANDDDSLRSRLQYVDDGVVAMTVWGTGRMTEPVAGMIDPGQAFRGIALSDDSGFGWGRVLFLAGVIGPYAIVSLGAGVLLALAPLMAGLLLLGGTVGVFIGWARGLAFCALGALALFLVESVELAIFTPWIRDVVAQRDAGVSTPSAPTELIVLALAFGVLVIGILFLVARIAFHPHLFLRPFAPRAVGAVRQDRAPSFRGDVVRDAAMPPPSRAYVIGEAMAATVRREDSGAYSQAPTRAIQMDRGPVTTTQSPNGTGPQSDTILGSSFRRTGKRISATGERRDRKE